MCYLFILSATKPLEYTFIKLLLVFSPVILYVPKTISTAIHVEHVTLRSSIHCSF